jgi:hypothetical protein
MCCRNPKHGGNISAAVLPLDMNLRIIEVVRHRIPTARIVRWEPSATGNRPILTADTDRDREQLRAMGLTEKKIK